MRLFKRAKMNVGNGTHKIGKLRQAHICSENGANGLGKKAYILTRRCRPTDIAMLYKGITRFRQWGGVTKVWPAYKLCRNRLLTFTLESMQRRVRSKWWNRVHMWDARRQIDCFCGIKSTRGTHPVLSSGTRNEQNAPALIQKIEQSYKNWAQSWQGLRLKQNVIAKIQ